MKITDLFSDSDVIVALEPDELGLRLLPWIATFPSGNRQIEWAIRDASDSYRGRGQSVVVTAIREAWAWLEGAALLIPSPQYVSPHTVRILSRKASQLVGENDPRKASGGGRLPKNVLHPVIREDVWSLYHRGKYDTAVFEAMKAVEVAARIAATLPTSLLGVNLMRTAFAPEGGPLTDMTVNKGERVARMELFAGAIGSYKNPHSHRNVTLDDPEEAAEIVLLANHLLRIVDGRAAAK